MLGWACSCLAGAKRGIQESTPLFAHSTHTTQDKDTYHALKNSVTKPLNDDIKAITDSGSVQFITDLTTKETSIVFDTVDEIDKEKFSIQKSVPMFQLFCSCLW